MTPINELDVESTALTCLSGLGYAVLHGPSIAPGEPAAERSDYSQVILESRLRSAIDRLNPGLPAEAAEEAFRKLTRVAGSNLISRNHAVHNLLVNGIEVECRLPAPAPSPRPAGHPSPTGRGEGGEGVRRKHMLVRVVDFDDPEQNDWLAVNQYTVVEDKHNRRADIVIFVNGMPLGVIELKNPAEEKADIWAAFRQLQTYKQEIPALFDWNAALVVSDGVQARIGTLTAQREWFMPWRTITGRDFYAPPAPSFTGRACHSASTPSPRPAGHPSPSGRGDGGEGPPLGNGSGRGRYQTKPELEVLLNGVFEKRRLLQLIRHFTVFQDVGGGTLAKKMAGYHQFHAVNVAVEETLRASRQAAAGAERGYGEEEGRYEAGGRPGGEPGDRRIGVVWHTQGAGKSLSMAFYAGRLVLHPEMKNPTIVVLTDRNDLDDQLFGTFCRCHEVLRQPPVQAESRQHLRELLQVASGGVIFTTIQKFLCPEPSPRPAGHPSPNGRGAGGEGAKPRRGGKSHYRGGFDFAGLVEVARELRQKETEAEEFLWKLLRNRQLSGAKFRRQHQFGPYVLDFYCAEAKLAVECDGKPHANGERKVFDHRRDAYLKSQGVTVLRFPNAAILNETERVLSEIAAKLPSTSGRGAGGEGGGDALSLRSNIVVIADEAHRSQYDFIDGFARHMRDALPNASFVGFTGTPIELTDKNTRAVFGDYISVYDIQRAVQDGATVPIYYEGRLAKLELKPSERPRIDPEFEEVTEGEEVERKEKLKTRWAQLEALVGTDKRLKLIAADLVRHYEDRFAAMEGKAMIVGMSRRICVELYKAIVALRPAWHGDEDGGGLIKVIMTGSASDPVEWQPHIRNKQRREELAERFRRPEDPFRIVIVRDMWLTGFDAPSLHTMYVDKPMRGHGLMQAIARVNRVFRDKPGGLVVDYLGLAENLREALVNYTASGGTGDTTIDQDQAVAIMREKYEVCCGLFHGFDRGVWVKGKAGERLALLSAAQEHILAQKDGKARCLQAVSDLSKAFALAVPSDAALAIRDDVGFFQAVRAVLAKNVPGERKTDEELEHAIRQIVSTAVASDEVVDIFAAAGLKKPDISILSDEFLAEVQGLPHKNLAVELLRKLLAGEIKARGRKNLIQARSFAEMLEKAVLRYQNRAVETAQVIKELVDLAKEMRTAHQRGEKLGLNEDELAFYDALEANDSAVKVLGEPTLTKIARELVSTVRKNATIDWTVRENVRAQLRVMVRRILRKHGYPPDKQERATITVLEQAEVIAKDWVA